MLSWVLLFIPIVVIIQSLASANVSGRNQQSPALAVHIEPHAFEILLLLPFPTPHKNLFYMRSVGGQIRRGGDPEMREVEGGCRIDSRGVVVDAVDESGDVSALVRADD